MGTLVGRSFLNGAPSLHVYNITFLVDSRECGQRNSSLFSERPGEYTVSASPPHFCVGHFVSYRKMVAQEERHNLLFTEAFLPSLFSGPQAWLSIR